MKKRFIFVFLILVILISCSVFVFAESSDDKYGFQKTTLNVKIENKIHSESSNLRVELMAFPKNTKRQISSLEVYPDAKILEDIIKFTFTKPGDISFIADSEVISYFYYPKINSEVKLPLQIPSEIVKYTKKTEHADIDDEHIKLKAKEIMTENFYETAFNIANYVYKNVEYDESYAGKFKKASWVLMNKKGVCAEYTNLFIALCRTVGIPARYVSGTVYSSKIEDFQEHAWAEIYNGKEWIPYDITFGQFGWIDSTHVLLQYMEDATEPTVEYYYTGKVSVGKLDINAQIIEQEVLLTKKTSLFVKPIYQYVSLDSYVPVEIIIENKENSYLNVPIIIKTAPEIPEKSMKHIFLEPLERKKTYLLIHIPDLERCKLGCKSDLVVGTPFNNEVDSEIYFSSYYPKVSYEEAMEIMNLESEVASRKDIFLDCDFSPKELRKGDEVQISCSVINKKESFYGDLCFEDSCERVFIETRGEFYKSINIDKSQLFCVYIREGTDLKDFDCLSLELSPLPEVSLEDYFPDKGVFSEISNLKITLKSSKQIKLKLKILRNDKKIQEFTLDLSQGYNIITLPIKTWKLKPGDNKIKLLFEVADKDGQVYEFKDSIDFYVEDVPFLEKIIAYIKGFFYYGF